jgi:hypothetical protein
MDALSAIEEHLKTVSRCHLEDATALVCMARAPVTREIRCKRYDRGQRVETKEEVFALAAEM